MLENVNGESGHTHVPECFMAGRVVPMLSAGQWRDDKDLFMRQRTAGVLGYTMDLDPGHGSTEVAAEHGRGRIINELG